MGVKLSDLVEALQADVPALNDVPSAAQYERAVKDAVADFSRRARMTKVYTLPVVSGTAAYELPADFLQLVRLPPLTAQGAAGNVLFTNDGLVPVSSAFKERVLIAGRTLTLYPTPAYTLDRALVYAAGYVLNDDVDPAYDDMTDDVAAMVRLRAQALALQVKANKLAESAISYSIGDESFKREGQVAAVRSQMTDAQKQYEDAVKAYVGAVTQQAQYAASEAGSFAPYAANPFTR